VFVDIDLGDAITFNVKLGSESYKLREPTAGEVKDYSAKVKEVGEDDAMRPFLDLVVSLGMPEEVAISLGVTKMAALATGLMGGLTEKK